MHISYIEQVSLAEFTPQSEYLGNYIDHTAKFLNKFDNIPLIAGVEAYSLKDFNLKSDKYNFLKAVGGMGFQTEVHLNDDALTDILTKKIGDSDVVKTLKELKNLTRVIFNLNAGFAKIYQPALPTILSNHLNQDSVAKGGEHPIKRIVLLYNESTENMVKRSIDFNESLMDDDKTADSRGIMFCPAQPVNDTYKTFKFPGEYNLGIKTPDVKYEYAGKLSPGNIFDTLAHLQGIGVRQLSVCTRGGVMSEKRMDFEKATAFCNEINRWQQDYTR